MVGINRRKIMTILGVIVGILIVVIVTAKIYSLKVDAKYPVAINQKDIQQNLTNWGNRGDTKTNPKLMNTVHLGKSNTYIAYFKNQSNGYLGIAVMKEGPNKHLRIVNSHYGSNQVKYYGVNTNKGNYGIIIGNNADGLSHYVQAELEDQSFKFKVQVPKKDDFIVVKKLPKGIGKTKFADLYFFDNANKEIKSNLFLFH
ncbi:hypothetical protein PU629_08900 [Pullulanibacillus sp. KACC 23026]|uniref:hypothetical protein n=1 Tax=Pullulanibacillus sp. KACC 23026 TaxID=3028315 RepID=UPI0023B075C2|nr:hypothetical protein [Pullulanibacillus sp. KACC 23026]WEG14454.1 hypothetical protein PU629_08900 [Pullulanibacillus sp. KACC 23026]